MTKQVFISWDIDGTLVCGTNAITHHLAAFRDACAALFGPCDTPEAFLGHSIDGWMDKAILTEMIKKLGFEPNAENLAKGQAKMEDIFVATCSEKPDVPAGVVDSLEALSKYPNVTMGLASGNYPRIGWRKLENAGIAHYFPDRIGGLGVVLERKDALILSRETAEKVKNRKFDIVMHIGDTPSDINAAIQAGAIPFGVRTGRVSDAEYPSSGCVVANLVEGRDKLWELLELK
jgi:phosphoglycolate phosphatase-like HAD superfamily hydrolase